MQSQTDISAAAEGHTLSLYFDDDSDPFMRSQSLYDGLTQREIMDLQRGYVEASIPSQLSSISSRRFSLKNRIKRSLYKIQKKKEVSSCKDLSKSFHMDKKDDATENISKSRHEPLFCYDQFKTNYPNLLFDLTMHTNRSNRSNRIDRNSHFKPMSVVKRSSNIPTTDSILTSSLDNESSYIKHIPPLSSSSMKRNNLQGFSHDSKRLRLNNDNKYSTSRFIVTNSYIPSAKVKQSDTSYAQFPYVLPKSPECSDLSSSSDSSKVYSIPTFREERRELTIPKLLGSIKLGKINLSSQGEIKLAYQDRSFYDNLVPDENSDISAKMSISVPSSPSILPGSLVSDDCILPDTSKIKFINKSSLLLYGKSHRQLTFNNKISETKPILKNRLNTKKDVEFEKAKNCDIVGVEQFLQFLDKYEDRKPIEEKNCEELRKKQLMRYYKEATQNLIKKHSDVIETSSSPLPPSFLERNSKTRNRKLTGLHQRDWLTKNINRQ